MDRAVPDLPKEIDKPTVTEITINEQFPIITILLSGNIPERTLIKIGDELKEHIETIADVLKVKVIGKRDEIFEIIISPDQLTHHDIPISTIRNIINSTNLMISSGNLSNNTGSYSIKSDSMLRNIEDFLNLPIKTKADNKLKIGDIAHVKYTYDEHKDLAKLNGQTVISLEILKKSGANIISTVNQIKYIMEQADDILPENITVSYSGDLSKEVKKGLRNLQNNIIFASLLILILMSLVIKPNVGFLVSLAIPSSIVLTVLFVYLNNYTLNMVVLFGLILSVGLLVDSAIVVCEYADQQMTQYHKNSSDAYKLAAKRMFIPVLSSNITTITVFLPLLFWPDVIGEFMKYIPITVIAALTFSMIISFTVIPALGSMKIHSINNNASTNFVERLTDLYITKLSDILDKPKRFLLLLLLTSFGIIYTFITFGAGTEFFPKMDPDQVNLQIKAPGNYSLQEKDQITQEIADMFIKEKNDDIKQIYSTSYQHHPEDSTSYQHHPEDITGNIKLEFIDSRYRSSFTNIIQTIRQKIEHAHGVLITVITPTSGPPQGSHAINLEISSKTTAPDQLFTHASNIAKYMKSSDTLTDIDYDKLSPELEWEFVSR